MEWSLQIFCGDRYYRPDRIRAQVQRVGEQIDYGRESGSRDSVPRSSAAFWIFPTASAMSIRTIADRDVRWSRANRLKLVHVGASRVSWCAR